MLADKLARSTAAQTHTVCHTQALCATHAPAEPLRKQARRRPGSRKPKPTAAAGRPRGRSQNRFL